MKTCKKCGYYNRNTQYCEHEGIKLAPNSKACIIFMVIKK